MVAKLTTTTRLAMVLAAALAAAPMAQAQTPKWDEDPARFQIELRYWIPEDLKATTLATGSVSGNSLDLANTVGIEEEGMPEVRFTLISSGASRVRFGYTRVRYRGLFKNGQQLYLLFALSNLYQARGVLMAA